MNGIDVMLLSKLKGYEFTVRYLTECIDYRSLKNKYGEEKIIDSIYNYLYDRKKESFKDTFDINIIKDIDICITSYSLFNNSNIGGIETLLNDNGFKINNDNGSFKKIRSFYIERTVGIDNDKAKLYLGFLNEKFSLTSKMSYRDVHFELSEDIWKAMSPMTYIDGLYLLYFENNEFANRVDKIANEYKYSPIFILNIACAYMNNRNHVSSLSSIGNSYKDGNPNILLYTIVDELNIGRRRKFLKGA